jgi:SAM-dependent methyltransferase
MPEILTQTFGKEIREGHLGGCSIGGDPATYYPIMWQYLIEKYGVKSVLDIGCGVGYASKFFQSLGCDVLAVDGSIEAKKNSLVPDSHLINDYEIGSVIDTHEIEFNGKKGKDISIDLGWSCEFVEHVYEKYSQNFIDDFKLCKYLAITYAGPNQGGYHHVNLQPESYWIEVLESNGFIYNKEETEVLRQKCVEDFESMKNSPDYNDVVTPWDGTEIGNYTSHFRDRGLFFIKK